MNALVTGAGGFIGRHLCATLLRRGVDVAAVSRPESGPPRSGVRVVPCPSWDRNRLSALLRRERPDVVFHLTGMSRGGMAELHEVNAAIGARLFEAALACPVPPRVIVAGSAAEYGRPARADGRTHEEDTCHPETNYGLSKLAQTCDALAAARKGLPVVVARLFNPVGPDSPASSLFGGVVDQIAALPPSGGELVTGPLRAVRDFSDVERVADVLVDLAQAADVPAIVNVASGQGVQVSALVDRLVALAPLPIGHHVDTERGGTSDIDVVIADVSRLTTLGLTPPAFDMDAVIARTLRARWPSLFPADGEPDQDSPLARPTG
jgi:GDP-4-dehydro-6-deoxy-D-mannose reductase